MANIKFSGNIGKEPELRYTPEGKPVLGFSVALYTGGTKEKGFSDPVWVRVSAFDDLAEKTSEFLTSGARVTVTGIPRPPRTWTDKSGAVHPVGLEITAREIELGDGFKTATVEDVPY